MLDTLSSMCDIAHMKYVVHTTNVFDKWLTGIKDIKHRANVISRIDNIQLGNFGDHKSLGQGLFELRFFFGPGFRAYYTIKEKCVVLLLCGGTKTRQSKDIEKARIILKELE